MPELRVASGYSVIWNRFYGIIIYGLRYKCRKGDAITSFNILRPTYPDLRRLQLHDSLVEKKSHPFNSELLNAKGL